MTHSLQGVICLPRKEGYNPESANLAAVDFFRDFNKGNYFARGTKRATHYAGREDWHQPIIQIFQRPIKLDWGLKRDPLMGSWIAATVESGSHVGFSNTEYAEEVYSSTIRLRRLLNNRYNEDVEFGIVFNDENRLYLPKDFRKKIREASI